MLVPSILKISITDSCNALILHIIHQKQNECNNHSFCVLIRRDFFLFCATMAKKKKEWIHMMTLLNHYLRRWQRVANRLLRDPDLRDLAESAGSFLAGFGLSAASLGGYMQPFCLGVLCAGLPGWLPAAYALGSVLGYWVFWKMQALQAILWLSAALPVGVLVARQSRLEKIDLLLPSFAALIVAAGGVIVQSWRGENPPIAMYLLRVGLAFASVWIAQHLRDKKDAPSTWIAMAVAVLALAQIAPLPYLNLGILAASGVMLVLPLPAVAMLGLALDLARITPVPMTAVLCLGALLRLLPKLPRRVVAVIPVVCFLTMMVLCGAKDLLPLPSLLIGGSLGLLLPGKQPRVYRRGETGFAQVRLEMAAAAMAQSEQLLQQWADRAVDERALMTKVADRACGSCPGHKGCKAAQQIPSMDTELLHQSHIHMDDLPVDCKKRNRLLQELRRSQDQLRILCADRLRQGEYRSAVIQQYHFLSEYLQELADELPQRGAGKQSRFRPEVAVCSTGREAANGDRCLWFAGTQGRYYLLLCDGMGTGAGAAEEAKTAGSMLRRLLMAGYPASYALRSINSLCTLRGRAGAVTMDLAEFRLDTGKVSVYKWGAAPSWLLLPTGTEQIGVDGMPPGISISEHRETVEHLTMRKGEMLVLLSDGVDARLALQDAQSLLEEAPGAVAAKILERGRNGHMDDATAAVIRLDPV